MTESERTAQWARWYLAAVPSYKAEALLAVWRNDRAVFGATVKALGLTIPKLMEHMTDA